MKITVKKGDLTVTVEQMNMDVEEVLPSILNSISVPTQNPTHVPPVRYPGVVVEPCDELFGTTTVTG